MKINNSIVLESAMNEVVASLSNGFHYIRDGMWWSLFDLDREEYGDDDPIEIEVDGEIKTLSALEIDKLILNKCEDLTVDIYKSIKSKNGMVLVLN